ncbi:hypothetical protein COJ10_28215 [Bacillus thuringiensis]|nr:hypothetical protein COJ10_28215 [Bacillus thuringiensis]
MQQAIYTILLNNRALSNLSIGFDYRVLGEEEGIFIKDGKSYNIAKYPDVINFYKEKKNV